ncbi:toxin-antitoxin system, antitoxin component, AbrB family protein [Lentilactobacillus otakiensis]|uniref:Uncharacterized protein n=1 Tax=Lentilactobacillus otakiensis DSM 19908 = JCM 15040 TaxID=1423780 RepID=S4NGK4_9LACO|nr:toxin-antitoxin system, antitoxin component, AbrB family protein [Lentilactobacillus otakiensis]MDV3518559.1 toxin-antitoxin system, antitoxin component, AbrB family protein [Lentilactobacillus otakiensis]GAD16387.1 hypothetical protein LOT_0925 [Lentilactobacillus otakiensis DSM 19908 = JCM 15040]
MQHDREIIEAAFKDVEEGKLLTEEEMEQKFGKYGWHD